MHICKLPGCSNTVKSWRKQFCCTSHASIYSASKRYGSKAHPRTTAEAKAHFLTYANVYSTEKQSRTKIATPIWANKDKIKDIYKAARKLTESTGIPHEVDHIIPLSNKLVCGLHVENNLQILPKDENRKKYNKFTF